MTVVAVVVDQEEGEAAMNTKFKGSYIPVPKSNLPSIKILKNKVKKSLLNYFLCLQFVHSFEKG